MTNITSHWTESSIADFVYRVGADFIAQIEAKLESGPMKQRDLAQRLNVTDGAVSQTLNQPGNFKIEKMTKYARAMGMKLSVVLYDDNDSENKSGPIHSDIFRICWEKAGKPTDFWAFEKPAKYSETRTIARLEEQGEGILRVYMNEDFNIDEMSISENVTTDTVTTTSQVRRELQAAARG